MRAYVAVVALCTIAALLTSEPCCGSGDDQEAPAVSWHSPTPAVGTEKNQTEAQQDRKSLQSPAKLVYSPQEVRVVAGNHCRFDRIRHRVSS
jgi:hypothetical protein